MARGSYILFLLGLIYVVASFFGSTYFVGFIGSADAQELVPTGSGGVVGGGATVGGGVVGGGALVDGVDPYFELTEEEPAFDVSHHLNKNYTCGGEKTTEMLNTIEEFQGMVDQIRGDEKCAGIRQGLNNNVPNLKDVTEAIVSDELAQEMREQKRRLRDVELEIRRMGQESSESRTLQHKKVAISRRISQLEIKLGIGEKAQAMKQYKAVLNSADKYFGYIGEAFQEDCIEDTGVQEQAFFSMTGIVGMFIGATPLGMGLAGASKLINHFSDIDKKYDTSDLDDVSLIVGIRCALRNTQKQHCELITNRELEVEDTEAQSCTDCPSSGFSKDIENLFNVVNPSGEEPATDPTEFFNKFITGPTGGYAGSAEESLVNLNTFVSAMKTEEDFMNGVGSSDRVDCREEDPPPAYTCASFNKDNAIETIGNIQSAIATLNTNGINTDDALHATFQEQIKTLSDKDFLKSFTELVLAYSDYQSERTNNYVAQNGDDDLGSPAGALRYINSFSIRDLLDVNKPNLTSSKDYQEADDQSQAEFVSSEYMETFSEIFNDHALKALEALEREIKEEDADEQLKNNMCMELVGLDRSTTESGEQSVYEDIDEKCKDTTVTIRDQTFKYSDYIGKPFEDRVCAMQNFMNCVDGITCFAHDRAQSSPPDSEAESSSDDGDASATNLKSATRK